MRSWMKEYERKFKIILSLYDKLKTAIRKNDTDEARSVCKRISRMCDDTEITAKDCDSFMLFYIAKSFEHDKKEKEMAMKIYEKAANAGNQESAWILANYNFPKNNLTGYKWYQKAADLGHIASKNFVEKNKDKIARLNTLKFIEEDIDKNESDETSDMRGIVF